MNRLLNILLSAGLVAAIFTAPAVQAVTMNGGSFPIPDNAPGGHVDTLIFPALPLQDVNGGVEIAVDIIEHSNVSELTIVLIDPNWDPYILYDQNQAGTTLNEIFSASSILPWGDLSTWIGQNPAGSWSLIVIDNVFTNNSIDGILTGWSITANALAIASPGGMAWIFLSALAGLLCLRHQSRRLA